MLEDIWLPEVEKEYEDLFEVSRDVGCDVGDQFREFMALVQDWDERAWKSIEPIGSAYLYGRYGGCGGEVDANRFRAPTIARKAGSEKAGAETISVIE